MDEDIETWDREALLLRSSACGMPFASTVTAQVTNSAGTILSFGVCCPKAQPGYPRFQIGRSSFAAASNTASHWTGNYRKHREPRTNCERTMQSHASTHR